MSGHKKSLSELNSSFLEVFGQDFTDAVAKDRKVPLQMKQTANEGKNFSQYIEKVRMKRMRVDHHKTAANSCACRETRSKVTAYLPKRLSLKSSLHLAI